MFIFLHLYEATDKFSSKAFWEEHIVVHSYNGITGNKQE